MQDRIKLSLIVSFFSLIVSLIIVGITPPANSYEISIYTVYPWYFWLMLMIPPLLLLHRIIDFFKNNQDDKEESSYDIGIILSIFSAIMSVSIFLLLPFFRGYYLYSGGDALSHLVYIKYIYLNHHFTLNNLYPIIHILVNNLSFLTGIDARIIMFFVPLIFLILFIISMYLLSTSLKFNKKQSLFVVLLSILPIFAIDELFLVPSAEAFFLIPLVLFVLIKSRVSQNYVYSILLVIFLIEFPFFHPEATFFLIIILSVICVVQFIGVKRIKYFYEDNHKNIFNNSESSVFTPILLISVAFFIWFSSSIIFGNTVITIYNSLILNIGSSPVNIYGGLINNAQAPLNQLFELFVKMYGAEAIYTILAAISALSIFLMIIKRKNVDQMNVILVSIFIVTGILAVIFLFKDLIIGQRPIKYFIVICILLSSLFVSKIILNYYKKPSIPRKLLFIIILFLIVSATFITYFNAYPSPIINNYNYQVQTSDYTELNFFFIHRNQSLGILYIIMNLQRWMELFRLTNSSISGLQTKNPPDHFGYNQGQYLGNFYSKDNYMVFNGLTEQFYSGVYPQYKNSWRFTPQDFSNLSADPTVNLIYDNSGNQIFYVKGKQNG